MYGHSGFTVGESVFQSRNSLADLTDFDASAGGLTMQQLVGTE